MHLPILNLVVWSLHYRLVKTLRSLCSYSDLFVQHFLVDPSPYSPIQGLPAESYLNLDETANSLSLSLWEFGLSLHNAFNLSPILSDPGTVIEPVAPSFLDALSTGAPPGASNVNISPTAAKDEILCHPPPDSIHDSLRDDCPIGRRATRKINDNSAHSQLSLQERFDDVMKLVRQFPPGDKPQNALFTQFFTKSDDYYVCLICPATDPKALRNRTQMIQHIAGGHGGNRPFACEFW